MPNKRSQIKGVHLYESLEEQTNVSFRNQKRSVKKVNEVSEMLEMFRIFLAVASIYTGECTCQNSQNCKLKMIVFNCK